MNPVSLAVSSNTEVKGEEIEQKTVISVGESKGIPEATEQPAAENSTKEYAARGFQVDEPTTMSGALRNRDDERRQATAFSVQQWNDDRRYATRCPSIEERL